MTISSSKAEGTKSTLFLTLRYVTLRKEQSGLSTLGKRRWLQNILNKYMNIDKPGAQSHLSSSFLPAGTWRKNDVALTSMRRDDVDTASFWHHMPTICTRYKAAILREGFIKLYMIFCSKGWTVFATDQRTFNPQTNSKRSLGKR